MKVVGRGWKWMKVDKSGWKWIKVDESGWKWIKWIKMDESGWKWLKVSESGWTCVKVYESVWKWMNVVESGWKYPLCYMDLRCHFWCCKYFGRGEGAVPLIVCLWDAHHPEDDHICITNQLPLRMHCLALNERVLIERHLTPRFHLDTRGSAPESICCWPSSGWCWNSGDTCRPSFIPLYNISEQFDRFL